MKRNAIHFLTAILAASMITSLAALASSGKPSARPTALFPSPVPDATPQRITLLRCEFERPGVKGEEGTECHAKASIGITRGRPVGTEVFFEVTCDNEEIFEGLGLATGENFGSQKFAISTVAAFTNNQVRRPEVWVDGDFLNNKAFDDRDARLLLQGDGDHDDVIYGTCDHPPGGIR